MESENKWVGPRGVSRHEIHLGYQVKTLPRFASGQGRILRETPRKYCGSELDNTLYNLEMMPLTLNQKKAAKVTQRQIDLAKRWNADGLLSDKGLRAVLDVER